MHSTTSYRLFIMLLAGSNFATPAKAFFSCPTGDDCLSTGCLYEDVNDCSRFYQCNLAGHFWLNKCPRGLEFNERIRICDYPPSPTCHKALQEAADEAAELVPPAGGVLDPSFSCNDALADPNRGCRRQKVAGPDCVYANPKSNTSYVQCNYVDAYVVQCAAGEVYNDIVKACEEAI